MKPNDAILNSAGTSVCPKCKLPVTEPYKAGGKIVRRHKERLRTGKLCDYGHGEGDPAPRKPR